MVVGQHVARDGRFASADACGVMAGCSLRSCSSSVASSMPATASPATPSPRAASTKPTSPAKPSEISQADLDKAREDAGLPAEPKAAQRQAFLKGLNAIDTDIVHGKDDKAVRRGIDTCGILKRFPGDKAEQIDLVRSPGSPLRASCPAGQEAGASSSAPPGRAPPPATVDSKVGVQVQESRPTRTRQ